MRRYAVILALGLFFVPSFLGSKTAQDLVGIRLGQSMKQVLLSLGPADGIFLSGENAEVPAPLESDPIVVRFEKTIALVQQHKSGVLVYFSDEYLVQTIVVVFDDPVSVDEVKRVLGDGYLSLRFRLLWDEDDLEGAVSDCIDPLGDYEEWLYPSDNLIVEIGEAGSDRAVGLRFTLEWPNEQTPECPAESRDPAKRRPPYFLLVSVAPVNTYFSVEA